ncbi:hypothetical protein PU634_05225 [Oceanimonas pelagia]|uniref:Phage portal protein n=1 Tax=Oceanimonas pelagia TaxID=3028314 RepID=A0AA50Q8G4_9GAMM|nr:hypothetical protein [Oceanimonas pelagia]WMC11770.1 hypothetical protein PU634_05225 [Oceanimonas pelagia]
MATKTHKQRRGFFGLFSGNTRDYQAEDASASDITPADTVLYGAGMTTVASLMASGNRKARTRQSIYDQWSMMEADPICSSALGLLVTAALGGHETNGDLIFIEKRPGYSDDERLQRMVEEIREDLLPIFNGAAFNVGYLAAAFGDAYARIYSDKGVGVTDLYTGELIRPPLVQPFERGSRTVGFAVYTGEKNFQRLSKTQMARVKMPRTQWVPQHGVFEKSIKLALEQDDIDALPLMPAMAGGSLLYPAEEPYNNLSASLLGLVGQRWIDSIDEQMLTVNLNEMSREQQKRFLESIKSMLTKSKEVAEQAAKGGKPILERIRHIIPVFGEKQLASMQAPNGGQTGRSANISIEDIMLHARLTAGAIGVDLSMVGFADQLAGGLGEGGFFRTSAQVAERARVIRVALADFFNQVIDVHTLQKYGVVFPASERPWSINFYGSISALEAEKQRTRSEGMSVGLLLVQGMQQLKELGADKKMMINFLTDIMALDEDQAEQYADNLARQPDDDDRGL